MKNRNQNKRFNWSILVVFILIFMTIVAIISCIIFSKITPEEIMSTYEVIMVTLTAYSSLSLLLLVIQLIVSKQDTRARHDEKRREKTVDYMVKWTECLSWETTYATSIVETFNHQQCVSLYKRIPFQVDYETKKKLCAICSHYMKNTCRNCLGENTSDTSEGISIKSTNCDTDRNKEIEGTNKSIHTYTVDVAQCNEIRWYVIKYLNHLEALLISWKQGIVDREIIEEQFFFLYDPISGKDALQSFRNIAGDGKSFPTLEEFCLELRNNRQQTTNKMKELL